MALIPLATEFNNRAGTPRQSSTNMYVEATPQGPRDFSLRGRPGLVEDYQAGTGPAWLTIEVSPTITYVLSGTEVYYNGAPVGSVAFGSTKQAAFSDTQLVIVSGKSAYLIEYATAPTVMTLINDLDLPEVSGVVFASGRFLYPVWDSGQYYYSEVDDAGNIDGLAFANAEANPDPIVRAEILGDQVVFFGTNSLEFHSPTSDPNAPFQRTPGQTQDKGCLAPLSVVKCDNGLFWIGQDEGSGRTIYRSGGGVPLRVSTHSIEAALRDAVDISSSSGFTYIGDGHTFYVVNVTGVGSFAYDVSTGKWAPWESYGLTTFRIISGAGSLFGDVDGKIHQFDPEALTDAGDPIVRVVSCFIPVEAKGRCNVICLEGATGVSTLSGQGSNAVVEMRYSDEVTGDFTDWEAAPLGLLGERDVRVAWWQLGHMSAPGRLFEFRYSDPILSVPYGVMMNVRP